MVATVLKIRFRVLGNTLARSPWQLVGFLLGALSGVWMLGLATLGLFLIGGFGLDPARYAVTAAGAVLTLGWVIGPVFAAGVDTTLDPAKLAPFPMSTTKMMVAITAGGATGIPGITTALGALATFAVWWRWPIAAAAAVIAIPLGFALCILASRAVASFAQGLGGRRRVRELIGLLAFALIIFASPLILGLIAVLESAGADGEQLVALVEGLSWTPVAAAWAVPGDLAAGHLLTGALKLAIAAASVAAVWLLWHRSLSASLVAPPTQSSGRRARAGALGWFGILPTGGTGASWARSLTYWLKDLRYLQQLLIVPLWPVLTLIWSRGDVDGPLFALSALLVAFFLGVLPYSDVSYDNTAFATVLQTGIRGRADRAGRMLAAASVGVPVVLAVIVITAAISGRWDLTPAAVGGALGMLLAGYGVCAVSSALVVVPVAAPGANPFQRVPGQTFLMFLAYIACWVVALVIASPALGLAIAAGITGSSVLGWIALPVGIVVGAAALTGGILLGGRIFDRTAPALLVRVRAFAAS
ncbi:MULTISPECIES: hypothetical protein [Microbacterium]|uniref:Transporter n=1 Tax=Microbacterium wangchenii TaxID=2541726 RepID=A0ABX5SUR8_9MICO|nr:MULTISPECIES: hypothetical protein [Microbacterium]MCK6067106.1 hypothetical protein [Microbacterium sp. EYE_512]QBR89933.1 hypothetical protein E4K62_15320 [Microbacterium wangchenii]TXK16471.1 hypothetical protein FVP99_07195 [Microbacterium wangchenii]